MHKLKFLAVLLFFAAGCAAMPVVVNENMRQGYDFSRVKTMMVLPFVEQTEKFSKRSAPQLNYNSATVMAQNLALPSVDVMEISDRWSFESMMQQKGITLSSGMLDEKDCVRIGEIAGVNAVLYGSVQMENAAGRRRCSVSVWIFDVRERGAAYNSSAEMKDPFGGIPAEALKRGIISNLARRISVYTGGGGGGGWGGLKK